MALALVAIAGPFDRAAAQSASAGPTPAITDTSNAATAAVLARDLAELRAAFTPRTRDYWTLRTVIAFAAPFIEVAVLLVVLFAGWSARARDVALRAPNRYLRALVYVALLVPVVHLLELPFDWFSGFWIEHRFDLSTQAFWSWMGERGTDLVVDVVFLGVTGLAALAYRRIERSPRRWWAWFGLASLPVIVFVVLIEPVAIDPLYNRFEPLQNRALEADIVHLAERAGIPARHVYQVDRSRQTKKYNAYVNGFGASQRIVMWDTLLKGMTHDEILFVLAHEMGHYRLGHIWKGILFFWVAGFAVFWATARIAGWSVRRFGRRWGVHGLDDLASMPAIGVALLVAVTIGQPIGLAYSRAIEHQADMFALELTHENRAGARAFMKLGEQNLSNPDPPRLIELLLYTHPSIADRVHFALEYDPWMQGRPNRAFHPASK